MNVALVIAGGKGQRTHQDIPKQFLSVYDRPIIIYTLNQFQQHPDIDAINVVCLDGWQEILKAYAKQFHITKLNETVTGGATVQESIRNGVKSLEGLCKPDDIVLIHDGIRPLVDQAIISDCIVTCRQHGNAVSSQPYYEQIFVAKDEKSTEKYIPRDMIMRMQTPQAYKFSKILWAYEKAFADNIGIEGSAFTNTMMVDLGETLYFSMGSSKNIKITTTDDIEIFRALVGKKQSVI